jgi:hypothetical protein
MKCTPERKKMLFDTVEALMKKASIEIRDTWDGYEGENYDDIITNLGRTDGPKLVDIIKVKDGLARLETENYTLPGFNSLAYERAKILIPLRLINKIHPIIHEAVHFLQHNTEALDNAWVGLKSQTREDFKDFVEQRVELEAHFVQLLYIDEYELDLPDEVIKTEFKKQLLEALGDTTKRVDLIVYAKEIGII